MASLIDVPADAFSDAVARRVAQLARLRTPSRGETIEYLDALCRASQAMFEKFAVGTHDVGAEAGFVLDLMPPTGEITKVIVAADLGVLEGRDTYRTHWRPNDKGLLGLVLERFDQAMWGVVLDLAELMVEEGHFDTI